MNYGDDDENRTVVLHGKDVHVGITREAGTGQWGFCLEAAQAILKAMAKIEDLEWVPAPSAFTFAGRKL